MALDHDEWYGRHLLEDASELVEEYEKEHRQTITSPPPAQQSNRQTNQNTQPCQTRQLMTSRSLTVCDRPCTMA